MKDGRSGVERFLVGEDDQNQIEYIYVPSINSEGHDGTAEQVRERRKEREISNLQPLSTSPLPTSTTLAEE